LKRVFLDKLASIARASPPLFALALVLALAGCDLVGLGGEGPEVAGVVVRTPGAPLPVVPAGPRPTPTITPVAQATPTPTPSPNLTAIEVQRLVFLAVSRCADEVSQARGSPIEIEVDATYKSEEARWSSEVASDDRTLSFGRWAVLDATGAVVPDDAIAGSIASPNIQCNQPLAILFRAETPPDFLTHTPIPPPISTPVPTPVPPPSPTPPPTPTPTQTPVPPQVITSEQAQLRTWMSVFDCYDHFPKLASFTAHEDAPHGWIVEGNSDITHYGIWQVDAQTGEITPSDILAIEASATCRQPPLEVVPRPVSDASFPAAVTLEQAELLVWFAVYDCFSPNPTSGGFTAFQDNPQRWLVEGKDTITIEVEVERVVGDTTETFTESRTDSVSYGLWLVDTSTATVRPWSDLARTTAVRSCYQTP